MPEQLRGILNRVIEWWKKFTTKQRILLGSIAGVIIIALIILGVVVSRPQMELLTTVESSADAQQIQELLEGEGIDYDTSDGYSYYVASKDKANASILLGANDIPSEGYDINDAVTGDFSMTTADKDKLYKSYLEKKIATDLADLDIVDSATVSLEIPDDDGTILSNSQESSAGVTLSLNAEMDEEQASGIARYIATCLGNESTEGVTILDRTSGTVLYSGTDMESVTGTANSQLNAKQKQVELMKSEVKAALVNSKVFSDVQVGLNLDMTFDESETSSHTYSTADGSNKGPISSESLYSSNATNGEAAEPGTGSNDDTTYVTSDDAYSEQEITQEERQYLTDETITKIVHSGGTINYDTSTISVVANRYVVYDQDTMEASGELDDITWEEFKRQNADAVEVEDVDSKYLQLVSNATGIPTEQITFLCYEQPMFVDSDGSGRIGVSEVLQIVLTVLIFALLGYVVFRSTRSRKENELEPELSVEALLEATSENKETLEDIGYSEKSDVRILIENFVDENPDAAALLLRNWLNEDWE